MGTSTHRLEVDWESIGTSYFAMTFYLINKSTGNRVLVATIEQGAIVRK